MTPVSKIMSLFVLVMCTIGIIWFAGYALYHKDDLPVLGEPGHTAGPFSFTNQQGQQVTEKDAEGKVTVVEYFFTSCAGICPVMNKNLKKVYKKYQNNPQFVILSHSVDPERDSVPVMARYAARLGAQPPGWQFLTGSKQELYQAAREDYLLAVEDTITTDLEQDFIHTEYVTLLDKQRRIRGFYNATDSLSIVKLIKDVDILLQ